MKLIDVILLLLVALAVFFALRSRIRKRRSGQGCGCGCGGCTAPCAAQPGARPAPPAGDGDPSDRKEKTP